MRFAILATVATCALAAPIRVHNQHVPSGPNAARSTLLESLQRSLSAVTSPVNTISSIASTWLSAASDASSDREPDVAEIELPLLPTNDQQEDVEDIACTEICRGWWFGEMQIDESIVCTEEALERIGQCAQCLDSTRPSTETRSAVARYTGLVLSCQAEYAY